MKKVNQRKRALSFLLVLTLLFGTMTLFSFASEEEVTVLYEEESKRTEHEKHYFCSDGSYIAVSYPQAVHYLDDDGVYRDIDNSLCYDEERAAYENAGNPAFGVSLSSENGLETVKVKGKDKEEITFSTALLVNGNGKTAQPKKKNINAFNRTAKSAQGKRVKGSDTFDLPLVSSSLEYAKYYGQEAQTVTGRYTLNGNSLKEDIVLSAPAGVTGFLTTYKAGGLTLTKNEDGSLTFSDDKGTALYTVGAPYMYDADGSACPAISVTVQKKGNKYEVSYLPDASWLNSSERVYPLTFDPALATVSETPVGCEDWYYAKYTSPNSNGSEGIKYETDILRAGYSSNHELCYIYFKPENASYPEIDAALYQVTSVYMSYECIEASSFQNVYVYRLNDDVDITEKMDDLTLWESNRGDFNLGTEHYTNGTLPEYVIYPNGTNTVDISFGSIESDNPPTMKVSYVLKSDVKFVLENGETNFMLSNGGTATARAPKAKETIDAEDFYYCEWTFEYAAIKGGYMICPAYDEGLCLQANGDGSVSLVTIPQTLTNDHYWYVTGSLDDLLIKSRGQTNKILYTDGGSLKLALASAIDDAMESWSATRTYQGVYTFRNVGQNKYLYVNNGLTYENTNIVLADKSAIASHKVDPFAFRLVYDAESSGYRIFPISCSNGTYREVTVNNTASSGSHSVKMKLPSESVYSTFSIASATYSGELLQCTFVVKDDPTLALTGTPTVVTFAADGNGNVATTDVVAKTISQDDSEDHQWILEPYKHTVHTDANYTDVEKYYSSLSFGSPFGLDGRTIELTSDFGNRIKRITDEEGNVGYKKDTHEGIDLRTQEELALYAPCSGRVVNVQGGLNPGTGRYVVIETDYCDYTGTRNIYIVYMHLSSVSVTQTTGEFTGQIRVGTSGASGSTETSYAQHLHYGIFVAESGLTSVGGAQWNGDAINPLFFYKPVKHDVSYDAPYSEYLNEHMEVDWL